MNIATVIFVGGDNSLFQTIKDATASKAQCCIEHISDIDAGVARIKRGGVAMAIVHLLGQRDEVGVARFLFEAAMLKQRLPTLVLSDQLDTGAALNLMQMGAVECMARPLEMTRLSMLLEMHLAPELLSQPQHEGSRCHKIEGVKGKDPFLIGSPSMQTMIDQAHAVATRDTTVLLTGETGTGKTRFSHLIHQLSPRRDKPFITVNCGALSDNLIDSELFGHRRGAFTGADRDRKGKFAEARDGTLFLDDIDSLSPEIQVKFLRALEERAFEPLGSDETQSVKARIIVATNKSLEDEVAAERFRSDLYYRLNVISFHLPPLRERREEVPHLAEKFVKEISQRHNVRPSTISSKALAALEEYDWPGNIRELRNVIERALALSQSPLIDLEVLPVRIQNHGAQSSSENDAGLNILTSLKEAKAKTERDHLLTSLQRNKNNRSRTAIELGISRVALYKKLHKFDLA